jgi:hypothetical protein
LNPLSTSRPPFSENLKDFQQPGFEGPLFHSVTTATILNGLSNKEKIRNYPALPSHLQKLSAHGNLRVSGGKPVNKSEEVP